MNETQRLKKVVNWYIYNEYITSEKDLAEKLGYTKSSLSQILNGKVPLSDKFVDKLIALDKNVNKVWILSGEGKMFNNEQDEKLYQNSLPPENDVIVSREAWEMIKMQVQTIQSQQRTIEQLSKNPRADTADAV